MTYEILIKSQIKFFFKLLGVSGLLFLIHYYILYSFFETLQTTLQLWLIYCVHFFLVYAVFSIINFRYSKGKEDVFNVFMAGTLLKMVLIMLFLLPLILSDQKNKIPDVLNFFLPYFIFLAFEVYFISKFLSQK